MMKIKQKVSLAKAMWDIGKVTFNQYTIETEYIKTGNKLWVSLHKRNISHERYSYMAKKLEDEFVIDQYETEKAFVSAYSKVCDALKQSGSDFSMYMRKKMKAVAECKKWKSLLKRRKLLNEEGELLCR